MPYTGSELDLKARLMAELESTITDDASKPQALEHLEVVAEKLANAIVGWLLANGGQSLQGLTVGTGSGTATGVGNLGAPVLSSVNTATNATIDTTSVKII